VIAFLVPALLLLSAVLFVLVLALRRAQQPVAVDRERLNVEIFRERRAELDAELASGRIGQAQHAALLAELELLLVDDVELAAAAGATTSAFRPRTVALALLVAIPLLSAGLLVATGFDRDVRAWLALSAKAGQVSALPAYIDEAAAQRAGVTLADAARLRQWMLGHDGSAEDWFGLGVSWVDVGIPVLAQQSFRQAQRLAPERTDIALALVRMDLTLGGGRLTDDIRAQFERVLAAEPGNQQALLLYGMAAFDSGEYDAAIARWQQLLAQLDPSSEGVPLLRESIAQARAAQQRQQQAAATPGAGIPVRVSLASSLGTPPPDAVLFVIVRAAGGAPMPIAAKKLPARLPVELVITDADQMMAGAPLAQRGPLEVRARLSRSGMPTAASGDLESEPVRFSLPLAAPLAVTIDRRIP